MGYPDGSIPTPGTATKPAGRSRAGDDGIAVLVATGLQAATTTRIAGTRMRRTAPSLGKTPGPAMTGNCQVHYSDVRKAHRHAECDEQGSSGRRIGRDELPR